MAVHGVGRAAAKRWETLMREKARAEEDPFKPQNFVVRFSTAYKISFAVFTVLVALVGGLIHIFAKDKDAKGPAIFLYILAAIFLLSFLYIVSYRCTVGEKKMVRVELWIFKKEIAWNRVKYKKTKRINEFENEEVILYDDRQKRLIEFTAEMVGFKNIERLVKKKNIQPKNRKK